MFVVKKEQNVLEAFKWTGDVNQTEDPVWIVDLFKKQRAAIIRKNGDILLRIFTMNKGLVDVGRVVMLYMMEKAINAMNQMNSKDYLI